MYNLCEVSKFRR